MSVLESLAAVLGLSFVSGINLYAAVLTVGCGIRFGWLTGLPAEMQVLAHPAVLIVAGIMYAVEFVADKIPFITPIWDGIHTFIRPLGAAVLAFQAAGNLDPKVQVVAALAGGSIALGSHSTKAGFRLLAHAAPEPASHSLISIVEDVSVVGLLVLAYQYPAIALAVVAVLIVLMAVFAAVMFRMLRCLLHSFRRRIRAWFGEDGGAPSTAAAP